VKNKTSKVVDMDAMNSLTTGRIKTGGRQTRQKEYHRGQGQGEDAREKSLPLCQNLNAAH
jgi:hypothetical protein